VLDRNRCCVQKEEIRRLEQRCHEADCHNTVLNQRLARSDQQRIEQLKTTEQLRHEIMDMQARLPQRRTASTAPLTSRQRAAARNGAHVGVLRLSLLRLDVHVCVGVLI
jgi:hypothetical protein